MERITITMRSEDIDLLERRCADADMKKSAYIRLLIAEHEDRVPVSLKYRELIFKISELNNSLKQMIISNNISDQDKLYLFEKMGELADLLKQKM